ncbi:hypothetical protein GCM10022215_29650 [Nocardioides fonticola]|uniref:Uncharacterized protein n=1 Tax=Nocardioides fonticola TaxID=450363 RepID=A0ABP7XP98_9ACTN
MRAALIDATGLVVNVIVLADEPQPTPVYVDGVQQFEDVVTGTSEDGEPIIEQRPVLEMGTGYTPPADQTLIPLDLDSPVGPGWSRTDDDTWIPPAPPETPSAPEAGSSLAALAALLESAGITPEQLADTLAGGAA